MIKCFTYLLDTQPRFAVRLPVVEVQLQLRRFVGVQVEGLVSVCLAAGLDLTVVATVVVNVELPGILGPLIEGDFHLDDVLWFAKVVLDPASLVLIIIDEVSLARPARVVCAALVTSVFGDTAVRGAAVS